MQKFIFIGLGGSGGKTLAYLHRSLTRRLQASGWSEDLPSVWQFLHIDPREDSDALGGDIPTLRAGAIEYLPLSYTGEAYASYDQRLSGVPNLRDGLAGWRPEPPSSIPPPYLGAGQRRAVGRVLTLANLDAIQQTIQGLVQRVTGQQAEAELVRLRTALGAGQGLPDGTHAVIVGSLAGGSGSGALIDMVQVVRGFDPNGWAENPLIVAYTPDCFDDLPLDMRSGINGNALGAMCELMAAAEGCRDERADPLLRRADAYVPVDRSNRIGKMTALIGRSSDSFSLSSVNDVYRTVGNALAGALTNEETLTSLSSFIVNTNGSSYSASAYRLSRYAVPELTPAVFSNACGSFGYASVGLGRHLFVQYASERLAKLAVNRLREGHLEWAEPGEATTSDRLIERVVEARWELFFEASGIYQAGLEHNQVLDALRDKTVVGRLLDEMRDRVVGFLRRDEVNLDPGEARDAFNSAFDSEHRALMDKVRQERENREVEWVGAIQERLVSATAAEIARSGYPVTLKLLQRLGVQVDDAVEDLRGLRDQFDNEARGFVNAVTSVFAQLRDRVTFRHQSIDDAAQQRRDATQRRVEIDLYHHAEGLLQDLSKNLLPQLIAAVARASENLEAQVTDRGLAQRRYEQWSDGPLPRHLTPSPNEFLLDPADGFPAQLESLLSEVYDCAPGDALSRAVQEVVTGTWPDIADPTASGQTLIDVHSSWMPVPVAARVGGSVGGSAGYRVREGVETFRERADVWLRRRESLSQFVGETLANYLRPGGQPSVARSSRFEEGLRSALVASTPLVRVDPNIDALVHGDQFSAPPTITRIPVAAVEGEELYERVKQALLDAGLTKDAIPQLCDANSTASECEIVRFTMSTKHPIVFESLTDPIAQEWASRSAMPQERSLFWNLRRSRLLSEFVPIGTELQTAMIRGWFTANLLGQVTRDETGTVDIWTAAGYKRFPNPLLSGIELDGKLLLPKLLEAYPLALLDLTSGRKDAIEAYERLIELGASGELVDGRPRVDSYTHVGLELTRWVRSGEVAAGAPTPNPQTAGPAKDDASAEPSGAARRDAVMAPLKQTLDRYASIGAPAMSGDLLTVDPQWEIRPLVEAALVPMVSALSSMDVSADGPGSLIDF